MSGITKRVPQSNKPAFPMIVIATDEAGYGPKLGPLVVTASVWELPEISDEGSDIADAFSVLATPVVIDGVRFVIDDSKQVYRPASTAGSIGYQKLEQICLAACRWCGTGGDHIDLLMELAPQDYPDAIATPWLESFASESVAMEFPAELLDHWETSRATLRGHRSRVIGADSFNRYCSGGKNKSDLLSETTLGLVRDVMQEMDLGQSQVIQVYCDRHGGRQFYAGPLQACFDSGLVSVINESRSVSSYRVVWEQADLTIRFSVKGDRFTPVAFSSLVAKYLREKAMESFNGYFAKLHSAARKDTTPFLKPTAGYPVDADRFLDDIRDLVRRQGIPVEQLVRSR